jgi:hypothetical protein
MSVSSLPPRPRGTSASRRDRSPGTRNVLHVGSVVIFVGFDVSFLEARSTMNL